MATHYHCGTLRRRQAVSNPVDAQGNPVAPSLNGMDFLEVDATQTILSVHFLHPLPGQTDGVPAAPPLEPANLRIEGGVRIRQIQVLQVTAADRVLSVTVSAPGDFSEYRLRLVSSATEDAVPPGFDPQLSEIPFSFKVDCPSPFDCKSVSPCLPTIPAAPEIRYLAKDYATFRRLIYDRMSVIAPDWRERNPADVLVTLVELLAHVGDQLSYYQDAVATEAYLGTARQRRSLRRHARLLDYPIHDGCNARAWIAFEVEPGSGADGAELAAESRILSAAPGASPIVAPTALESALAEQPVVFETLDSLVLRAERNAIPFYTWSDLSCCLPRGSTRATLRNDPPTLLAVGDVLVFEEVLHPATGLAANARRAYRHAVRLTEAITATDPLTGIPVVEIAWASGDALPFDLQVSSIVTPPGGGPPQLAVVSVARGNVVAADHGRTLTNEVLDPETAPEGEPYRPRLPRRNITMRVPFESSTVRTRTAADSLRQDQRGTLPAVRLEEGDEAWFPRRDLLASDRFAPEFVVETEMDGTAYLRFGDDVLGKRPAAGSTFSITYRIGNGTMGNVGPDALTRVVTELQGVTRVWNPLPAVGGLEPETLEEIRQFAPQAFRRQERAVTEADWVEVAQRHPEVQRAAATFRWTGSWYTVFVTLDRTGGREVDAPFEQAMRDHLERYRIAGYDLEINGPVYVPLEIELTVCVKTGFFRSDVELALRDALGNRDLADGRRGFFHPDHFTFGQTLFLSRLVQAAMAVEGVASVTVDTFQRWRQQDGSDLARGYLPVDRLEIVRCDNDPNFPENGRIEFHMHGDL